MTERKDIGARLENWGRWTNSQSGGADSVTAIVCERMRKAALGDVWSGATVTYDLDERDAMIVDRAMGKLQRQHRLMLYWTYHKMAPPEIVARKVGVTLRPVSVFVEAFRDAQHAIAKVLDC